MWQPNPAHEGEMILGRLYRDEEGCSRVGRIHISLEHLAKLLNLKDEMNLVGLNVDPRYLELVVCISGPTMPLHREGDITEMVRVDEVSNSWPLNESVSTP